MNKIQEFTNLALWQIVKRGGDDEMEEVIFTIQGATYNKDFTPVMTRNPIAGLEGPSCLYTLAPFVLSISPFSSPVIP